MLIASMVMAGTKVYSFSANIEVDRHVQWWVVC